MSCRVSLWPGSPSPEGNDGRRSLIELLLLFRRQSRGVGLYITHLKPGPRAMFETAGVVELLGEEAFCKDVGSAMARVEQVMRERAL